MGLTMYESAVHGFAEYQSLVGQLNGLTSLPKPEVGKDYHWILSMNAGQAAMLRNLFPNTTDPEMVKRSVEYGRNVAKAIFEWSKTDGGHEGNTRNFDPSYFYPSGRGKWSPPLIGQSNIRMPLHPYWGNNRTFTSANAKLALPKPLTYSNQTDSDYYKQFREVYDRSLTLTQEEKEIALWWGDDPSDTYSPPGHSYNLTNIAVRTARPNLIKAAESYARVGMAVADAFICCWKTKYTYHSERPASYIRSYINGMWLPFWPEPPFPAFSSGHATQGAAAATVLADIYGDKFEIVDDTHNGRPFDTERQAGYKTRKFSSFWATAEESAMSRLYGGIHTRQDNETGLQEGKKIGQNINNLKWKK
ncbi:MAG: vanadium-dependent haloperoxidase [Spirosomaceae bacterium]|nr:vanadium-dependent haloperoxidase [Spirosomataceae bacterium]